MYAPYKKHTQIFGNGHCPLGLLGKPSTPLYDLVDRRGRKTDPRLIENWKYVTRQITLTSLSLYTDSGPLPGEYCIVGIPHNKAIYFFW